MGCSVSLYRILIKWALPVSSAQLLPATLSLRLGDGPGSRSLLTKQGSQVRGGMSSGSCPRDLVCWGGGAFAFFHWIADWFQVYGQEKFESHCDI